MSKKTKQQKMDEQLKKEEESIKDDRNIKCEPLVPIIFDIIARGQIKPKENMSHAEEQEVFGPIQREINIMLKEKNLTVPEVTYTFSIVQGVLDLVKSYCNNSIEFAFKIAEQKAWGVDSITKITLHDIDNMLQFK